MINQYVYPWSLPIAFILQFLFDKRTILATKTRHDCYIAKCYYYTGKIVLLGRHYARCSTYSNNSRNYAGIVCQPLFGRTKSHSWRQELKNYIILQLLLDTWISRKKKQPVNVPTYVNTDRFETSPLKNWRHFSTEITRLLGSARKTTLPVHFWGWLSLKALNPRVKSELIEA